ncbi:hypothetical protein ABE10_10460, partial [Bacillus toyonensis]|nr:hypothetical protein [Bacillus toyonensis]
PVDQQLALGRLVHAGQRLDEGGLPRAVVAEHAGHRPRGDLRGDAVQRVDRSVALADALDLDDRSAHDRPPPLRRT